MLVFSTEAHLYNFIKNFKPKSHITQNSEIPLRSKDNPQLCSLFTHYNALWHIFPFYVNLPTQMANWPGGSDRPRPHPKARVNPQKFPTLCWLLKAYFRASEDSELRIRNKDKCIIFQLLCFMCATCGVMSFLSSGPEPCPLLPYNVNNNTATRDLLKAFQNFIILI